MHITLNFIYVTYIFTKHTFNVSMVRMKVARSTIGSSEGGGGDDGNYYDLPHVRRGAARPVPRIRHSEVVLVDAPLDNGWRKRIDAAATSSNQF